MWVISSLPLDTGHQCKCSPIGRGDRKTLLLVSTTCSSCASILPASYCQFPFSPPTLKYTADVVVPFYSRGSDPNYGHTDGVLAIFFAVFICSLCVSKQLTGNYRTRHRLSAITCFLISLASCHRKAKGKTKVSLVSPSASFTILFNYKITFQIHFLSLHVFFKVTITATTKFFECFSV